MEIYKPTDKEQHPSEAEERDESRVQSHEESESWIYRSCVNQRRMFQLGLPLTSLNILSKALHTTLKLGSARMQHMSDMIV